MLISDKNDVVYFEQGSVINFSDGTLISSLFSHCNGNTVNRIGKENENRTSIVFLGNTNSEYFCTDYQKELKFPKKIDENYFNTLPKEINERQGRERFVMLPTFNMEKIKNSWLLKGDVVTSKERKKATKYEIIGEKFSDREYKEVCKIIECLSYFLNDKAEDVTTDKLLFQGLLEISKSILEIKKNKYTPFYYKNEAGRRLALALILNDEEIEQLEEAHFFKNRVLLKYKDKNYLKKIALNPFGKIENRREYEFYRKNQNLEEIVKIIEISEDSMEIKQENFPLFSSYFKVKMNQDENIIDALKQEIREVNKKIELLKCGYNILVQDIEEIINNKTINYIKPPLFLNAGNEEQEILNFQNILKFKGFTLTGELRRTDLAKNDEGLKLINFSSYIKF